MSADPPTIDVYAVGVLWDLRTVYRYLRNRRQLRARGVQVGFQVRKHIKYVFRGPWRNIKKGKWREAKNCFNGYLAEPTPFPEGLRRCGSGWTRKRALRRLYRQARMMGVELL